MKVARTLNLLLLIALFVGSAVAWPDLPERIPVHFGASGEVDRWSDTTLLSWFALPLVALALIFFVRGAVAFAARHPKYLNVPDKQNFLRLPAERQRVIIETLKESLEPLNLYLTLTFCIIQYAIYRAALGADPKPYMAAVLALAVLGTPIVLVFLHRRVGEEIERQVSIARREGKF